MTRIQDEVVKELLKNERRIGFIYGVVAILAIDVVVLIICLF